MRRLPSVLIIEDVASLARTYSSFLAGEAVEVHAAATGKAALCSLEVIVPHVVILDINLPDMNGLEILRQIRERGLPTEVVVVTSNGSINIAVDAMREGAFDFIVKPFTPDRLRVTVRNALDRRRLSTQLDAINEEIGRAGFCGFIGSSIAMQAVYRIIECAAPSNATAFITGESGTGKELCAEAIHRSSKRRNGPFVAVNCAAIPQDLLESELFGHVKGAFTGATADRLGAAMRAHGGTLFLDEIGEMRPDFQAKMLRFLQSGVVQPVGGEKSQSVDTRIVCATNRDPRAEVAAGRFREDLFYRLYVIPIELPALRERDQDVLMLARYLLEKFAREDKVDFKGFSAAAEQALLSYSWPGNVRELQNVVRKIVVLGQGPVVDISALPPEISRGRVERAVSEATPSGQASCVPDQILPLQDMIDKAIAAAIAHFGGSIPKAATALKVSPSTIYRRLGPREDVA